MQSAFPLSAVIRSFLICTEVDTRTVPVGSTYGRGFGYALACGTAAQIKS